MIRGARQPESLTSDMREWLEPPDVEPVCPRHGCAPDTARPIPCPECEAESEDHYADIGDADIWILEDE